MQTISFPKLIKYNYSIKHVSLNSQDHLRSCTSYLFPGLTFWRKEQIIDVVFKKVLSVQLL